MNFFRQPAPHSTGAEKKRRFFRQTEENPPMNGKSTSKTAISRRILLRIMLTLGILFFMTCPCQAASNLTVDRTIVSRGTPLNFTYDLSDRAGSFDHAELHLEARAGSNFYPYDAIQLSGIKGTVAFSDTDRGDRLNFYLVMLDSEGNEVDSIYPDFEITYSGDPWVFPHPVTHSKLNYSAAAANTGETISVDYEFTGGTGDSEINSMGWQVCDTDGSTLLWSLSSPRSTEFSGTLSLNATMPGLHKFYYHVEDSDGWHYQFFDQNGILVSGDDLTGAPLSLDLFWSDENGNPVDIAQDPVQTGQKILLSWSMSGGYTAYEGYYSMTPVSGNASFSYMGQNGPTGSFEFTVKSRENLELSITVHDNHGNVLDQTVTIPVKAPDPEIRISRAEQDYYLFPDVPLAEWSESAYSTTFLTDIEAFNLYEPVSWQLEQISGTAVAELITWEEYYTVLSLKALPSSQEDCVWTIHCVSGDGQTLGSVSCTVHFKDPNSSKLPESWEQISMMNDGGKWVADLDESIMMDQVFRFKDGWSIPGETVTVDAASSSSNFEKNREFEPEGSFRMTESDIYPVDVSMRCCNIVCDFSVLLYVRDSSGDMPKKKPIVSMNAYGEPTQTGDTRFYFDSGLTISESIANKAFSLPWVLTCTVENMELFPDGLQWEMTKVSGNADLALETRNNGMNADLAVQAMPTSAGVSAFEILCLDQGEVIWRQTSSVDVRPLNYALPTGNLRTGGNSANGMWYAAVGEEIPMSDSFEFTNSWRIPGESNLLVSMDSSSDSFWDNVWCGEGLDWIMQLWEDGIYSVTVFTSCCNVTWGQEYTLYVGVAPRITGDTIRIPGNVKEIQAESFMNTNAEIVIIPEGCEAIGDYAFANAARLKEVEIPASVKELSETAFSGCGQLVFITKSEEAAAYAEMQGFLVFSN